MVGERLDAFCRSEQHIEVWAGVDTPSLVCWMRFSPTQRHFLKRLVDYVVLSIRAINCGRFFTPSAGRY